MNDFSISGDPFNVCSSNLEKVLKICEEIHLALNWEKMSFYGPGRDSVRAQNS